jgi:hypothetical protein
MQKRYPHGRDVELDLLLYSGLCVSSNLDQGR